MIRQDNTYKRYFDALLLGFTIFAAIEVPLHLALQYPKAGWRQIIGLVYPVIFTVDILVTFFTTITVDGEEITSRKEIAVRYLRSWFIVDFLAATPFDLLFAEGWLSELSNAARSLRLFSPRYIRILLMVRMLRIYHILPFLQRTSKKDLLNPGIVRLIFTVFIVLVIAHWISCGWIALGKIDEKADAVTNYIRALYWTITTITTIGYGDITPTSNIQTLYTMVVQLIGAGMYGYIIGNLASLLANSDLARTQFRAKLEKVQTFLQYRDVPQDLQDNIRTYYDYLWNNRRGFDESAVLQDLPQSLKLQVALHLNRDIIEKVPMFKGAPDELIRQIVLNLRPLLFTPGDYIFRKGEMGDQMYFISRGKVEVVSEDGKTVYATLGDGAFFGEIALLFSSERTASVRAAEYCDLYTLDKYTFDNVLSKFPGVAEHVKIMAEERRQRTIAERSDATAVSPEKAVIENVQVSYQSGRVLVDWPDVPGASGYQVTRWDDQAERWVYISRSLLLSECHDVLPLRRQTNTYRVRAIIGDAFGPWSKAVHVNA
ncbi:MAG TPA: ion transporter [Turneriella sp.]|nr:ion transporter [Turneriella sp.]HMY11731.1 ion transporter [Turneriella sp.]HNE18472.1 ion transporter [Turneriella sp.]HNJ66451.1 ion transporter [Turneriella sp.]HNL09100.1 ion transporter [Turneriella sp.]